MTEQLALPGVVPAMVQDEPIVPVPPVTVKLTVPVGVIRFASVTVAEHVVDCPPTMVDGAHDTVVLVGSVVNGSTNRPSLPARSVSAPLMAEIDGMINTDNTKSRTSNSLSLINR